MFRIVFFFLFSFSLSFFLSSFLSFFNYVILFSCIQFSPLVSVHFFFIAFLLSRHFLSYVLAFILSFYAIYSFCENIFICLSASICLNANQSPNWTLAVSSFTKVRTTYVKETQNSH